MKKNIISGLCILSVFLLCSLSYQPIIAEKPIEKISQQVMEFRESKNDCGCEDTKIWGFPILCTLLLPLYFKLFLIVGILPGGLADPFLLICLAIYKIAETLGCWWVTNFELMRMEG
jgi:hypothetical protein